jgi:ATP-binding cassette subfamily B protein
MSSIINPAASPQELADSYSATTLVRRLLTEYGLEHWPKYAFAFALMGIGAGCTALFAYLIGNVINTAYLKQNFTDIIGISIFTVVVFAVKGIATYGHAVILSRIGNAIVAENQRRMFDKLLRENLGFFAQRHSSELVTRLTTAATSATQVINLIVTAMGRDLLSLIALLGVMVMQDPVMSGIVVFVVPPALILLRKLVRRVRAVARAQFTGTTRVAETLLETLQGMRIVKTFTMEDAMRERLNQNVLAYQAEANRLARVSNRASPIMETLGGIGIALALVYGGYRVVATGSQPGDFFSFITAFLLAFEPAKRLARFNLDLNSGLVGVRILFEILDTPPTEPDDRTRPDLKIDRARLAFNDVRFGYRPGEPVLTGLSFVAEAGKTTALVGPSGGGKSTILNLILRLYEAQSGIIDIDGQNIAEVSRASLRRQVAYVGQDVFLFRGTIRENIAFGKPGASEAEIVAAAKAAYAHDFITAFPAGYDSEVGEHGSALSGGQRQRIAVARALIKNAPVILLDEATASLDSESERQVQDAIAHLTQDRTTIVIAHRLHTVAHAHRIYVIEDGTIAESGQHEDLLRKGGRYASFYRLQLKSQERREPAAAVS